MRRTAAVVLFIAAILVSAYAWNEMSDAISLAGNAYVRYRHAPLMWHLRWVFPGLFISGGFVVTARGRWRFAAAVPVVICAFAAYGTVVLTRASA